MLNPIQLLCFLVVVLVLFGNRLPGVARSLGESLVEFKKGIKSGELEDKTDSSPKSDDS